MRLYFNTNGFAHHRLDDALRLLADLGYDGVSLTPDVNHLDPLRSTPADVERLRDLLGRLGLGCTIESGARFVLDARRKHWPSLMSSDGFARRQRFYLRLIDLAAELGAPLLSIWSGRAEDDTPAGDAALERLAERLVPVLDHAQARSVTLCFEPEPGMRVETLADFDALRARVRAACGIDLLLTIDLGHLAAVEEPPWHEHLARHREPLRLVQADDAKRGIHEHLQFGDGDLDLGAMGAALRAIDFQGPVAVELSRHSVDAPAAAETALRALRAAGF